VHSFAAAHILSWQLICGVPHPKAVSGESLGGRLHHPSDTTPDRQEKIWKRIAIKRGDVFLREDSGDLGSYDHLALRGPVPKERDIMSNRHQNLNDRGQRRSAMVLNATHLS
jgi:hypothetical protein